MAPTPTGVPEVDEKIEGFVRRLAKEIQVAIERNPFRELKTRVVLASGARTGSHLLGEKLQSYGADFKELFSAKRVLNLCSEKGFKSLAEYCDYAVRRYSNSGVFGVKGGPSSIAPMLLAGELPDFAREWGWIHLTREDVVQQAVSHSIARKSGAFRSRRQGREVADSEYDGAEILEMAVAHSRANLAWDRLFEAFSITPCRVTYEALAADPDAVAADLAERLGLHGPPVPGMKPPEKLLQKQAGALNSAWEERFLKEHPEFRGTAKTTAPPPKA